MQSSCSDDEWKNLTDLVLLPFGIIDQDLIDQV